MWPQTFEERLRQWHDLRERVLEFPLEKQLHEINSWWSHAPRVNPFIHWHDKNNWLDPWELLAENGYCELASALGLAYTILLVNSNADVVIAQAVDSSGNDSTILIVNDWILNWDISSVISKDDYKFKIKDSFNCSELTNKIGLKWHRSL